MRNKRGWLACVLFVSVFAGIAVWRQCGTPAGMAYRHNEGVVFNTLYHIVYQSEEDYQSQIEEELRRFDASLSPFNPTSIISRFNQNDTSVVADMWFSRVFNRSKEIWRDTEGAFDPTVSPLINAWGFGFKNGVPMTPEIVDSLWHLVGMERVELLGGRLYKDDPRMTLNFDAVVMLDDAALATSGNYRNFRIVDGRRVAHTINPATGYPVQHSLLSATVLASDCMTADAYATAFMVLGVEKSMEIASRHPDMEVYLIYAVDSVDVSVVMTPGMRQYIFGE